jgi:hypothetical protein
MKLKVIFIGVLLLDSLVFSSYAHQDDFTALKGPYLGQKPPGMIPEIFAPDIITNAPHSVAVFSSDGLEVFWVPWSTLKMKTMKLIDGVWTKPQTVSFALDYDAEKPMFTADGTRLFFTSTRPLKAEGLKLREKFRRENIWYVDREPRGDWSEPALANFSGRYFDFEPLFTPDNNKIKGE